MILVDASVLIDSLRSRDPKLQQLFVTHQAAVCGVTLAEVMHGAKSAAELQQLATSLGHFPQVSIPDGIWETVGRNLFALRIAGVTVPFQDAVLATVAIENDIELWARDAHFPRIQTVLPKLKLFQEPP